MSKKIFILIIHIIAFVLLIMFTSNTAPKIDLIINNFGQSIDNNLFITKFFIFIAGVGDVLGVTILSIILLFLLIYKRKTPLALLILGVLSSAVLSSTLIKSLIQRVRPENMIIDYHGFSFPSGHSVMAILFYGILIYLIKQYTGKKTKLFSIFFLVIVACLICFSRIYLSVHWFTDVVAGLLLGSFFLLIFICLHKKYVDK